MPPNNTSSALPFILLLGPVITISAHGEIYLSAEQAAKIFFPKENFTRKPVLLSLEETARISAASGSPVKAPNLNVLVSKEGSAVFTDQVIGKHELITYAVGIAKNGTIQGVEILEYRESYGGQIKREAWRRQFTGKTGKSEIAAGRDIKNLSGATLSSTHVTDGVRRVLQTYEQIKKRL